MRKGPAGAAGPKGFTRNGLARTAPLVEELRAIGKAHGVTPAQVALAWLISFYGDTVVALPGASKVRQAEEAAAAMAIRLSDKELSRLDELSRAAKSNRTTERAPAA